MFEWLIERARRAGEAAALRQARMLAERVREEAPPGVRAEAAEGGVVLSGRGVLRRFSSDPALRWLIGRAR
jgi:hypothetical protein